ncbi:AbrB/MazE/SpoVT family DNA-binding domain-containing protein [Desulfuromonas acetexigens]|nr:AbrB/MazE/SpoVT family DNA-binding domain-containing protein [Desulfuromonas acetexigens]
MPMAKLSSKAQIVLPAAIRKRLHIEPGDTLEITEENNVILIRKAPESTADALGACGSSLWRDYEKELEEARDQWSA